MWESSLLIALASSGLLMLLLLLDWQTTGYLQRIFQAKPTRPPQLIDLAAETPEENDDNRPTWLLLTRLTPEWNADTVAELCARVWNVPVTIPCEISAHPVLQGLGTLSGRCWLRR